MTQFEFALKCDDSYETNVASTDRLQTNHSPNRSLNSTVTVIFASFAYVVSAPPSSILGPWRWHYPSPTAGDQILHGSWIEFLGRQKFPINRVVALIICHLRDPLASQRSVPTFQRILFHVLTTQTHLPHSPANPTFPLTTTNETIFNFMQSS